MATFYRFHWDGSPEFSAANAWSALWGTTRTADGTQTQCVPCDGTGEGSRDCPTCKGSGRQEDDWEDWKDCPACKGDGQIDGCDSCDGEGANDCQRGYSCFEVPETLIEYFVERGEPDDDDGKVIVFEGEYYGAGFDGEDLAVPTRVIEEMTWSEFRTRQS